MEKSSYDKLTEKFAAAMKEYEAEHTTHRVDVSLSVSIPREDSSGSTITCSHTVTCSHFLSANVATEDIKFLRDDALRPDEPPDKLQDDICAISNAGDRESAIDLAEAVVRAYPTNARVYLWLGERCLGGDTKEKGLQTLEEGLRIAKSEAWLSRHDMGTAIEILTTIGQFYIFEGQADLGREQLNTALEMAQSAGLEHLAMFVASIVEQYKQWTDWRNVQIA